MSSIIAFAPEYNTPGRKDATGAFQPEAERFLNLHLSRKSNLTLIDNHASDLSMRRTVLSAIENHRPVRCVAFFCHGTKRGIQFGFNLKTAKDLAKTIAGASATGLTLTVPLYSCDTGRDTDSDRLDDMDMIGGDGGFADTLRDALCLFGARPCRVDAHTTTGHTTRNPYVRRFAGIAKAGGVGGYYIIPPRSKLWGKWKTVLKTAARFEYPFLLDEEIYNCLGDD